MCAKFHIRHDFSLCSGMRHGGVVTYAYIHQWTMTSLIADCDLSLSKSQDLSEPGAECSSVESPEYNFGEMWIKVQQFEWRNTLVKVICQMAAILSRSIGIDNTLVGQTISLIRLRKSRTRMTPGFSHSINTGTFAVCIHEQTPLYEPACWDDWFGICRSLWWKLGWRR